MSIPDLQDESTPLLTAGAPPWIKQPKLFPQFFATILACQGSLLIGFVLGYSSPVIPELQDNGLLQGEEQVSWFASISMLGAILGGVTSSFTVDYLGRKGSLLFGSLPYIIGCAVMTAASGTNGYILLYIGRFVSGISVGIASASSSLYVSEVATKDIRGALGTVYEVSLSVGQLFMYGLGIVLPATWLAISSASVSACLACAMYFVPETPRWLVQNDRIQEARAALVWFRGSEVLAEEELDEIKSIVSTYQPGGVTLSDFTSNVVYWSAFVTFLLMIFQQFSGIDAVIFYSVSIFESAGFNEGNVPSVIMLIAKVVASLCCAGLIDRIGRRKLLVISGATMAVSLVIFGLYYYLKEKHIVTMSLNWMSLGSSMILVIGFTLGWGSLPYILMSEILPMRVRGVIAGVAVFLNWTCAFIVTKEFPVLSVVLNAYGMFWTFAGINALGVLFVLLCVPETKNRSLEEIEIQLDNDNSND